jgi:prepilin-type N-terminal cleavage/methylation domain-containing protein
MKRASPYIACSDARPRRAGFTLIECLFAAAILAVGIIGILSLIPMSIRQVSASLGSTVGATAAKNALTSLQHRQLDLCDYAAPDHPAVQFQTSFGAGTTRLNVAAGGTPLWTYPDMPAAICDYDRNTSPVGCGISAPTFKVPGLAGEQFFTPGTWAALGILPAGQNYPNCIPVPWARDFGWTAVFVPISADDDGDGSLDEDPPNSVDDDSDGLVDEDDLIMPGTCYRVQVAVWRAYRLLYNGTLNGTFTNNSNAVTLSLTAPNARQGDYIRLDRYGVWHKIAAIQGTNVTLQTPFNHPSPGAAAPGFTGPVSIAGNFQLLGLYETVITPRSLRDMP